MKAGALISVDVNLNNGSGHTASTTSVLGAKDLSSNQSLGTIIGKQGFRSDFSNASINRMMLNFLQVEETTSQDPVKTTITRKYIDRTTLLLQSHFIAVRGRDVAPDGSFEYQGKIYEFAECPDSPFGGSVSAIGPKKNGAAIIIGKIYNEISETDEETQVRSSSIYREGSLVQSLSYNGKSNPEDLSLSKIKLGYTLDELRQAVGLAGVSISGMPSDDSVLFDVSGTLDSVLSSVASSLGYYMFVDPRGGVKFISGQVASSVKAPAVGVDALEGSYTISYLTPVKAATYWGLAGKVVRDGNDGGGDGGGGDRQRIARFRIADILGDSSLDIDKTVFSSYYGSFLASAFSNTVFDAITYFLLTKEGQKFKVDFAKYYEDKLEDSERKTWQKVYLDEVHRDQAKKQYEGKFDLEKGCFFRLRSEKGKLMATPSNSRLFKLVEAYFTILDNIYVSNKYSKWKAQRMQMQSGEANISGPFSEDEELHEISATQPIATLLKQSGVDGKKIEYLQDRAGSKGMGKYSFIAIKSFAGKKSKTSKKNKGYDLFNDENFIVYQTTYNMTYVGFSQELLNTLTELLTESKTLFDKRMEGKTKEKTIRCPYTMARKPVNDIDGEEAEQEQQEDDKQASGSEEESKKKELADKFQEIQSNTILYGASGDPMRPVQFDLKNGTIPEVNALQAAAAQRAADQGHTSSSRTLLGIQIPDMGITTSSISIKVGAQGPTTTIGESSVKLLSPDDTLIIARASKASSKGVLSSKTSARQRNALGL